jgi:SAM-dependent methyltransferase
MIPTTPSVAGDAAQRAIDERNAAFWDELCGTGLAKEVGIVDRSAGDLRRFDAAYLELYPYLTAYLPAPRRADSRVLELGLGYGTVGQILVERGFRYEGVDIANGPVQMMRARLNLLGRDDCGARVGSALDLPFESESFDHYVSIGCLHHTGDVPRAVAEARRVLAPGGEALVMLYNAHSFRRRAVLPARALRARLRGRRLRGDHVHAAYDVDSSGESAPQTEFFSRADAQRLFAGFDDVQIRSENFDPISFVRGRITVPRERLLGGPAHRWGLDLYITARKPRSTEVAR